MVTNLADVLALILADTFYPILSPILPLIVAPILARILAQIVSPILAFIVAPIYADILLPFDLFFQLQKMLLIGLPFGFDFWFTVLFIFCVKIFTPIMAPMLA